MEFNDIQPILKDEKLFTYAFQHAAIGMALVATTGEWLMVNNSLCKLLGYTEQELLSKNFRDITHPLDVVQDTQYIDSLLNGVRDSYHKEKRYHHKDGRIIHVLLSVSLVRNTSQEPLFFISQIQDITEQKELEKTLVKIAKEDPLTGVCNRRCFTELTTREIARVNRFNEKGVLLMIDVDHFKKINDTYGHAAGDVALKQMASLCENQLRSFDVFGRLGGEEFCVFLSKTDPLTGYKIGERLRKAIEKMQVVTQAGTFSFTVSIGGIAFAGNGHSIDRLLNLADAELYKAKASGRNNVIIRKDASLNKAVQRLEQGFIHLEWHEEYECGHKIIDSQHKNLFILGNELLAQLSIQREAKNILPLVEKCLIEVAAHFRTEEKVMESIGYPHVNEHKAIHEELLQQARSLIQNPIKLNFDFSKLLHFLVIDIVHNHLMHEDRKFFPLIQQSS